MKPNHERAELDGGNEGDSVTLINRKDPLNVHKQHNASLPAPFSCKSKGGKVP